MSTAVDNVTAFRAMFLANMRHGQSVCVGLDPVWDKIPASLKRNNGRERPPGEVLFAFNQEIIDHTLDIAGCYKPQSAYYEVFGSPGIDALRNTRRYLGVKAPGTPAILDAKRGDIDRTNEAYATAVFDSLGFDAVTLHPYLGGHKALRPFLNRADKGCIVLCRTSNQDAGEFQDDRVLLTEGELDRLLTGPYGACADAATLKWSYHLTSSFIAVPLYHQVALRVANYWNEHNNCCLVVGATYPDEAALIRRLVGDRVDFLVPGVGTQGGELERAVHACRNSSGEGLIVNSSSGIIHASSGADFAAVARQKAIELNDRINEFRVV